MMRKPDIFKIIGIGTTAVLLALFDNSIKEKIEAGKIDNGVIEQTKGLVEIEKHHNQGIPMNKFDKYPKEVSFVSSVALIFQALVTLFDALDENDTIKDAANVLVLAGALSNTYDRLERGYVVDYIKFRDKRTIYNLSDFFIFIGLSIKLIKSLFD